MVLRPCILCISAGKRELGGRRFIGCIGQETLENVISPNEEIG